MKKILLLLTMVLISITVDAQEYSFKRHELGFKVGFGDPIADKRMNDFEDEMTASNVLKDFADDDADDFGQVTASLDYHYHLSRRVAVGLETGWSYNSYGIYTNEWIGYLLPDVPHESVENHHATFTSRAFFVAPSVKYQWYETDNQLFRFYSRLAVGALRQHLTFKPHGMEGVERVDRTRWRCAPHVVFAGVEFGHQFIRLYSELGYGTQGIFTTGFKITL